MKVVLCNKCKTFLTPDYNYKSCECGKTRARFIDTDHIRYHGSGVPIVLAGFTDALEDSGTFKGIVVQNSPKFIKEV